MPARDVKMKDKKRKNKKKRILFFPYAHQFGSTAPLVEMARFLKQQGHEVLVAGEGPYMQLAQNVGLDTEKVYGVPYEVFRKNADAGSYDQIFNPEYLEPMLQDDQKLIKKFKPDFMIHYLRFSVPVSGHLNNIKTAGTLFANITHWYSGYIDFPRLEPKMNMLRNLPFSNKLIKLWPLAVKIVMNGYFKKLDNYVHKKWPTWKKDGYHKLMGGADYTLVPDCKELFPVKQAEGVVQLGPIINNLIPMTGEDKKLIKRYEKQGYKIVFVNLGSSTPDKLRVIRNILQAFKKHKEFALFIAEVNQDLTALLKEFPDMKNRLVIKHLFNVHEIAPSVDVIITHGGKGSIYDALAYNMAMVVIPNQAEQELNGIVLQKHGIAKLYYKDEPGDKLVQRIEDILESLDKIHERIEPYSEKIRKGLWKAKLKTLISSI